MPVRSKEQSFIKYWTNMQTWANENKIPSSALVPVFNYDVQRLKQGYPMSEAERYRAVLGAAGRNATVLPTTTNRPSDIIGNVHRTLWDIFTGLNPVGLVKNFVDTIKNTVEHPMTSLGAFVGTKKALNNITTHPTRSAIAEFVPGALDVLKVLQGSSGITTLASHPIFTLIDALPVGEIGGMGLKAVGLDPGEIAARRAGIDPAELQTNSNLRNFTKLVGTIKSPSRYKLHIGTDEAGNPAFTNETIGQTIHRWAQHHNIGSTAGEALYGALTISQKYTKLAMDNLQELDKFMLKMPDERRAMILDLLQKSGKTAETLINTDSVPLDVRSAIKLWMPIRDSILEYSLGSGKIMEVPMPTGSIGVYNSNIGKYVQGKVDALDTALQKFNDRKSEADIQTQKATELNDQIHSGITQLSTTQKAIWGYITQTLPSLKGDIRDQFRSAMTPQHRWDASNFGFNKDRINRLVSVKATEDRIEKLRQLGLPVEGTGVLHKEFRPLTKSHANVITALFKPGGLIDRMSAAWDSKQYAEFRDLSLQAKRYLSRNYAQEIHIGANPELLPAMLANLTNLYELAKQRKLVEDKWNEIFNGVTAKGKKASVVALEKEYKKAQDEYQKYIIQHPPDNYRPLYLDIYTKKLLEHIKTPELLKAAKKELSSLGYTAEQISELNSNPRVLMELLSAFSDTVYNNPLVGKTLGDVAASVKQSALEELSTLRAQGYKPEYVPNITRAALRTEHMGSYNIFVGRPGVPSLTHTFSRTFEYGSSVFNFMAGVHHAVLEKLQHEGTLEYHNQYILPQTLPYSAVEKLIQSHHEFRARLADVKDLNTRGSIIDEILQKTLGLIEWKPDNIFNFKVAKVSPGQGDRLFINKDLADTISKIVQKGQLPMRTLLDKGTGLFKMSILGLSPRFTLHIAVGGTYLLALRTNPAIFRFLPQALKMAKEGTIPDEVMHSITQEGNEAVTFHYMGGRTAGRWAMEEWLKKHGIDPRVAAITDWINAGANLNFRFTRFVANAQRALAFFDGVSKVGKLDFVKDEEGKLHVNTTDRSMYEGMKAVRRVMGDLRHMSPFERQVMTRIFPFYGWTKHILTYVLSMPIDHPFRAQILADMAEANSGNVTSLLPLRIQLLLFLGHPDQYGNVTAITDRYSNPLRTVGNYASLSGWLSALNPIASGFFSYVDPQITYGTNSLYPSVSYTHVFGIDIGKPQGTPLSIPEAIVPQLQSLTIALGLSSQYRNLAKRTPAQFKKDLYESFNIPFFNVQHINLKEIAARNAIDKYKQASAAVTTALSTGTFKQLTGYGTVPYPLNPVYNISPHQLELLYQQSIQQYGLPPQDVQKYQRSPALL